jgi:PAS domain S-box-containing protein
MQRMIRRLLPKTAVLNYGIGLLVLAAILLFVWPGLSSNLLATGSGLEPFMPHSHCYLFIPQLVYLHLSSDFLIGVSYVAISFTLAYLVYRARRDIPFHWVFLAFGLFIIACGGTHFMEIYTTYNATYWLAGYVKLVTAVASVATAVILPPLVPRALALMQAAKLSEERRRKLEAANQELEKFYRGELESQSRNLAESEERYRSLADAMPQIVWTARSDGYLDYYNRRWFEYTGMTMEQTAGWGWQPVLHPDDVEMALRRWASAITTGESYQVEYRFRRASDGQYRWHLGRGVPQRDAEGRIIKWFGTSTDIDDQKRAEEAAREANTAKDNFLATLSHELRAPLTPVIGWLHMMRSGMIPVSEFERCLGIIDKNSHMLMRLINDLIDMSAIMSGKMRIESLPVSLSSVLREAIETVEPEAEQRRISIELTKCAENNVKVRGDRVRLVQIFGNLLNNAVKFSQDGRSVRVKCEADGENLRVVFEDEGEGIDAEFLPHVFERFRQADESKTRAHGGLGIGLALVRSFVEAHGGRVEAESAGVGSGSRFTIYLPRFIAPSVVKAIATDEDRAADSTTALARLLIVEDAEDTLTLLQTALGARGYRTSACDSAQEALRVAAETKFDLIVSDIGLPQMDGYALLKRLRELPHLSDVPAIALTGYAAQKDAEQALDAGFDLHLAKPIEPSELVAAIEQLLERDDEG